MSRKIQIKRGSKTNLPTLADGEFGLAQDTKEIFVGNQNQNIQIATGNSKVESVPSTTGYVWQTSYNPTYFTENGEKFLLSGNPNSSRKKVVFIGSSVCYGLNATDLMGWANKVKTTLEGRGWTVINHAIPGDNTQAVINRWFKDVVPERPDVVVIALSLGNEGLENATTTNARDIIYDRFRTNLLHLIRMVRQLGAIPIIGSTYPKNIFSATDYEYIKQISREIESWGVYMFNLMGNVDDGAGHYIPGTVGGDGTHPSDYGYDLMYKGVPTTVFENLHRIDREHYKNDGYLNLGTDKTTVLPIFTVLSEPVKSFTIFFKLRGNGVDSETKVYFSFGAQHSRIRNTSNFLEYCSDNGKSIMSTLNIKTDTNTHDVALSYSDAEGIIRFYVDGVLVGSVSDPTLDTTNFAIGGTPVGGSFNSSNTDLKDFLFYRVKLSDDQITSLSSGQYLKSGLELHAPLSDKVVTTGRRLLNVAPTNSYLLVNSTTLIPKTPIKSI